MHRRTQVALIIATPSIAISICYALPLKELIWLAVAVICCAAGVAGLSLVRVPRMRLLLQRLFVIAFAIHVAFTFIFYQTGLNQVLGGADDTAWIDCWAMACHWRSGIAQAPNSWVIDSQSDIITLNTREFPQSLWHLYDGTHKANLGYHYFSALFFYYLGIKSQIALACLNCLAGALTVLIIFALARQFSNDRIALWAATAAMILPSPLVFSALTIKDSWVVLFETATLFACCKWTHKFQFRFVPLIIGCIALALSFRFYAGWFLIASTVATLLLLWLQIMQPHSRPMHAKLIVTALFLVSVGAIVYNSPPGEMLQRVQNTLARLQQVRTGVSTGGDRWAANSAVRLDYDLSTIPGSLAQLGIGTFYLLLSPLPWQLSGRQLLTWPDLICWWAIMAYLPFGIYHKWRRLQPQLLITMAFVLPLLILYALTFGNVGLVYRQRLQFMPSFVVIAAIGYDALRRAQAKSVPRS